MTGFKYKTYTYVSKYESRSVEVGRGRFQQIKQYPETHTNKLKFIKSVPTDKILTSHSNIPNGINFNTEQSQYHQMSDQQKITFALKP